MDNSRTKVTSSVIEQFIHLVKICNPNLTDDEIDVLFKGKEHPNIVKHIYIIDIVPEKGVVITKKGELDEIRKKWREKKVKHQAKYASSKPPSPYKLFIKEQYNNYLHLPVKERLPAIARAWTEHKNKLSSSEGKHEFI